MIDKFREWFEGTWENKVQAFTYPARFAMVRIIHKRVGNYFYGEQAYNYQLHSPYRTFVIEPVEEGNNIRIKNFTFDKSKHRGFKDLESLELTPKPECDNICTFNGREFRGSNNHCDCLVPWKDEMTYLQTDVVLGKDYYNVVDRGFKIGTAEQIWGSKHGSFEFKKISPS